MENEPTTAPESPTLEGAQRKRLTILDMKRAHLNGRGMRSALRAAMAKNNFPPRRRNVLSHRC